MHLIHHPNGTASTVFGGRVVFKGDPKQAEKIGRELEWGERCPVCLKRTTLTTEQHCPAPDKATNGQHEIEA